MGSVDGGVRNRLRLGYGCAWWHPRQATWSYIAWNLRAALQEQADVIDIEAQRSLAGKAMLGALYAARPDVPWQYSPVERALLDRAVRRAVARQSLDAVIAVGEVDTPISTPMFLYQDTNVAAIHEMERLTGVRSSNLQASSERVRKRRGTEQLARARGAAGIFVFGRWYADFLSANGVDPQRIAVVGAGMNSPPTTHRDPGRPATGRLLFVGTDFRRKGGDLVVEAVSRLRSGGDTAVRLTVVGPEAWPLPGPVPDFVDFLGNLAPREVGDLYPSHDLFVMPSRFEAFGIFFAEALVAGLPCIARDANAMPDIVEDGVTGRLVSSDDPDALAAMIGALLADPDIYMRLAARRESLADRYSWGSVARAMIDRIDATLTP